MKKSMRKVDKIVTWLIIWWAVASIFWVASQTKKWKEVTAKWKEIGEEITEAWKEVAKNDFLWCEKVLLK